MASPTLPPRLNLYEAEAWVRYRLVEAVLKIRDWESLAGNVLWRRYPVVAGTCGALHAALRNGALAASGLKASGSFETIPAIEWDRMRPTGDARYHHPYVQILVDAADVRRLWPERRDRLYEWDRIQGWYPEIMADRPDIGKRGMAVEIRARYEHEIGGQLPSESVIEKDFTLWKKTGQPAPLTTD